MTIPKPATAILKVLLFITFIPTLLISCGGGGGGGGAPTGVAVAPAGGGGLSPCDVSTGGCNITWNQVADGRVTGYRIYIGSANPVTVVNAEFSSDVAGVATVTFNFDLQSLAAVDPTFTANSLVSIAISAIGSGGVESPLSTPITTTI